MKKVFLFVLVFSFVNNSFAQIFSVGVRGGVTVTHSDVYLPGYSPRYGFNIEQNIPAASYHSNNVGVGAIGGFLIRAEFGHFFLQAEFNQYRFIKRQAATYSEDMTKETGSYLNYGLQPGDPAWVTLAANSVTGTTKISTTNTIDAISIPLLIGGSFAHRKFRVYVGPSLVKLNKAMRSYDKVESNTGQQVVNVPERKAGVLVNVTWQKRLYPVDLLSNAATTHKLRDLTVGVEAGFGLSLPVGLELDFRYSLPTMLNSSLEARGLTQTFSATLGYTFSFKKNK